MPSSSKKQHNFMAALANNPSFAKKVGVSQSVGKDFNEADKGRKFGKGGATQQRINKQDTKHGKLDLPVANLNRMAGMKGGGSVKESKAMVGKEMMFMKKKGAPASMIKHEKAEAGMGMKKGGMPMKDGKPAFMKKFAKGGGIESHGKTKGTVIKMAAGGSVSARADGIAQRGKTKLTNY